MPYVPPPEPEYSDMGDKPFVAIRDYKAGKLVMRQARPSVIPTFGVVIQLHDSREDMVEVRILETYALDNLDDEEGLQGWVPLDAIRVGNVEYGDRTVKASISRPLPDLQLGNQQYGNNQLARAVSGLLDTIRTGKSDLGMWFVEDTFMDYLGANGCNIPSITNDICNAVKKAGQFQTLCKPNFTYGDLFDEDKDLYFLDETSSGIGGLYFKGYQNVRDHAADRRYAYVGKAQDFADRAKSYVTGFEQNVNNRYYHGFHGQLYRKTSAADRDMVAIMIIDRKRKDYDRFVAVSEQIFTLLLETYREAVLVMLKEPILDLSLDQARRNFVDMEMAYRLSLAADKARELTKWPGAVRSRPASLGANNGVNWKSPLFEVSNERIPWIRTEAILPLGQNKIAVYNFTRARNSVAQKLHLESAGSNMLTAFTMAFGKGTQIVFNFSAAAGGALPAVGTPLTLVFEITKDGSKHPFSFARLADIGPFADWHLANSIALKVTWQDSAPSTKPKFYARYIRWTKTFSKITIPGQPLAGGTHASYVNAMAVYCHLMQKRQEPQRNWQLHLQREFAVVKAQGYDHLRQSVTFKDISPPQSTINAQRFRQDELKRRMSNHVLQLTGIGAGQFPPKPEGAKGRVTAQRCDTCKLRKVKCKMIPGTDTCEECRIFFDRPCSFTWGMMAKDDIFVYHKPGHDDPLTWARYRALVEQEDEPGASTVEVADPHYAVWELHEDEEADTPEVEEEDDLEDPVNDEEEDDGDGSDS